MVKKPTYTLDDLMDGLEDRYVKIVEKNQKLPVVYPDMDTDTEGILFPVDDAALDDM